MQIRRPRGITVPQLMVVTAIGFLGGVYIWQPLILKYRNESKSGDSSNETSQTTPATTTSTKCEHFLNNTQFVHPINLLFLFKLYFR